MSGHVIRSPVSTVREVTVSFCSAPFTYFWEFCARFWSCIFRRTLTNWNMVWGSKQDGEICGNCILCHWFVDTTDMHWTFPLSHSVLGSGDTKMNNPGPCPRSEDSGKNLICAYPGGPSGPEGWSLCTESIQLNMRKIVPVEFPDNGVGC